MYRYLGFVQVIQTERFQEQHTSATQALIATEPSFLPAAAASACATAFSASFFFSSISFTFFSSSAALWLLVNVTLLLWLDAPIEPVCGVGTFSTEPEVERPRWNEDGRTRPSGCWYGQFARVHAVPNLQGIEAALWGARGG